MSEPGSIDTRAYSPDSPDGADYLGIEGDVESIASLVAARDLAPPLCVGIFGSEGSGVSFFLKRVQERVDRLVWYRDTGGPFCSAIQLTYNPYHYAGTNQWLALTERVFQALQDSVSGGGGLQLLESLGTARKLLRELDSKRASAQRVVEIEQQGAARAQAEYDDALREHASRQSQSRWAEIDTEFAKRIAHDSSASLDRAGDIIGLPGLSRDTEALHKVLEEAKTLGGRASLLNSTLTAQRFVSNAFLVVVVVLLVGLASWVFTTMFSGMTDVGTWVETVQNTLGAIATIGTFFVIVGALLIRNRAAKAIDTLRRYEQTLKEVIDGVDRQRDYREVLARQQELVRQRQIEGSSARLAEAERNLGLAEQALAEMVSATGLQRGVTEAYRTLISSRLDLQPSIVPVIREDFEALTQLLAPRYRDRQDARTPERIIIYIDDLDQCPPAAVADVIQVVQLLLAFPIFVVVIGANPAWLMASLETRYDVRAHEGSDSLSTYLASPAVRSVRTLSKCIHVPFWLAPLTRHSARELVHSMLGPSVTLVPDEPAPSAATSLPTAHPVEGEAVAAAVTRRIVTRIAGAELAFLEEVAGILADSPRTVKRLVNCYQLLRAILPVASASPFVGDSGGPPGYIAAITQLGLLISAPLAAPRYVELLKRTASLEDLRSELRAQEGIDPAEMEVMLALIDAYSRSADRTSNVEALRRWISPAARFSFTVPPALAAEAAFEL